jgi:hypothetical protein
MEDQERWKVLCERAAKEQDSKKLMQLTQEIIRLLNEKDARLKQSTHFSDTTTISADWIHRSNTCYSELLLYPLKVLFT